MKNQVLKGKEKEKLMMMMMISREKMGKKR
jgi:hypothetical protein